MKSPCFFLKNIDVKKIHTTFEIPEILRGDDDCQNSKIEAQKESMLNMKKKKRTEEYSKKKKRIPLF